MAPALGPRQDRGHHQGAGAGPGAAGDTISTISTISTYVTTISTISTGGLWLRPAAVSAVVPRPLGRGGGPPPPRPQVLGLQSSRLIIGQSLGLDIYRMYLYLVVYIIKLKK